MPVRSRPHHLPIAKQLALNFRAGSSVTCVFILLTCFCLSAPVKAQKRTIGQVLDIEGDWFLDGEKSKSLLKNDELPAGGVIRVSSPSRFAFIVIRYSANNEIISRRCRNSGECDQPILLPRAIHRQLTLRDYLVQQGMKILRLGQVTPSVQSGRSPHGLLRESVVRTKAGQVDLAPVFAEMNDGNYDVRLQRRGSKTSEDGSELTVRWESGKAITTPIANLQAGLYEVVLSEKRGGELKPTLTTAWFLVTNADQYDRTMRSFAEATKLSAPWKKNVSEGTVRDFLRAILIHLESNSQPAERSK